MKTCENCGKRDASAKVCAAVDSEYKVVDEEDDADDSDYGAYAPLDEHKEEAANN